MHLHRIAGQFYNRPLLLLPSQAETISAFLLSRIGAGPLSNGDDNDHGESVQAFAPSNRADGSLEVHKSRASRFYGDYPIDPESNGRPKPYRRTADGTAIITLVGELVNRGAYVGASSGVISYEGFKYQLRTAQTDDRARNVILDMESPGGEAVGAFEAAQAVRDLNAIKPVIAVVDGMSASAGYAIASGAREIVTIPTGITGSIGVVMMHLDFSAWLKDQGIKPTLIFAGDHKVDGNPFEPLPKDVRDDFEREVQSFYSQFVQTVATGRSNLSEKQIRATQARVFKGEDAVKAGLADRVGTFDDVLTRFKTSSTAPSRAHQGAQRMSNTTGQPAANAAGTVTQEDHTAAVDAARAEGVQNGTKAVNDRITAILANAKVKGKESAALDLAMKSPAMSVDDVAAFVEKNVSAAAAPKTIDERMQGQGEDVALGGAPLSKPKGSAAASWDKAIAKLPGRSAN